MQRRKAGLRVLIIIVLMVACLSGCSALNKSGQKRPAAAQKKAPKPPKVEQLVGTIALVSLEESYVLIDSESRPSPVMGTLVRTRPEGTTPAEMRVTEIRKRPFVIADIVSGTPEKGDAVFQ